MNGAKIRVQIPAPPPIALGITGVSIPQIGVTIQDARNSYPLSDIRQPEFPERLAGPLAGSNFHPPLFDSIVAAVTSERGMSPMIPIVGVFDPSGFWQNVASLFATAAVWAQHRATPQRDPVAELTHRLRNPVARTKHAFTHPIVTLRRKLDRRRSV